LINEGAHEIRQRHPRNEVVLREEVQVGLDGLSEVSATIKR
jgi:hypothetical protein